MSSTEPEAYKIMKSLDVDYVLVIFGGMIGYSGDDINKFLWMVRIAEGEHPKDIRVSFLYLHPLSLEFCQYFFFICLCCKKYSEVVHVVFNLWHLVGFPNLTVCVSTALLSPVYHPVKIWVVDQEVKLLKKCIIKLVWNYIFSFPLNVKATLLLFKVVSI